MAPVSVQSHQVPSPSAEPTGYPQQLYHSTSECNDRFGGTYASTTNDVNQDHAQLQSPAQTTISASWSYQPSLMVSPVSPVLYTPSSHYATPSQSHVQAASNQLVPQSPAPSQIQHNTMLAQVQNARGTTSTTAPPTSVSPYLRSTVQRQLVLHPPTRTLISLLRLPRSDSTQHNDCPSPRCGQNTSTIAPTPGVNPYLDPTNDGGPSFIFLPVFRHYLPFSPGAIAQHNTMLAQAQHAGVNTSNNTPPPGVNPYLATQATAARPSSSYSYPGVHSGPEPAPSALESTQAPEESTTPASDDAVAPPPEKAKSVIYAEKVGASLGKGYQKDDGVLEDPNGQESCHWRGGRCSRRRSWTACSRGGANRWWCCC